MHLKSGKSGQFVAQVSSLVVWIWEWMLGLMEGRELDRVRSDLLPGTSLLPSIRARHSWGPCHGRVAVAVGVVALATLSAEGLEGYRARRVAREEARGAVVGRLEARSAMARENRASDGFTIIAGRMASSAS